MNSLNPQQIDSLVVDTKISAVTVYRTQALVIRRGSINLSKQIKQLVITDLPTALQTESIRATGTGTTTVKLLGVKAERIFSAEPVEERVAEITRQIAKIESERHNLQDQVDSLIMQRDLVKSFGEKSIRRLAESLALQQTSLEQTRELVNFIGQQYNEYALAIAEGEKEHRELEKQIQALEEQLKSLHRPSFNESYSLTVAIAADDTGEFELEISYVVDRASWIPLYDVRVHETKVNLTYLAEIKQSSGEDWEKVKLTLSTAQPGLGTLPPTLSPWYIDAFAPVVNSAMVRVRAAAPYAGWEDIQRDEDSEDTLISTRKLESPTYEAQTVAAQVKEKGGVVTFVIDGDGNIPSDGTPHKITIFNDNFDSQINYVAMPKLVSFAYQQATVTNPTTGAMLLAGRANVFRENMFVGTTQLASIAPGEEFELNLGIDESIKIERSLVEREVDKRFISGQRRTTYAYRLTLTNLRSTARRNNESLRPSIVKLTEQLPLSRNEKIKVQLTRIAPQISLGEMNLLEWQLIIAPHAKQEVYYQFTVEHPPELDITGLNL